MQTIQEVSLTNQIQSHMNFSHLMSIDKKGILKVILITIPAGITYVFTAMYISIALQLFGKQAPQETFPSDCKVINQNKLQYYRFITY